MIAMVINVTVLQLSKGTAAKNVSKKIIKRIQIMYVNKMYVKKKMQVRICFVVFEFPSSVSWPGVLLHHFGSTTSSRPS